MPKEHSATTKRNIGARKLKSAGRKSAKKKLRAISRDAAGTKTLRETTAGKSSTVTNA